MSYNTFAGFYDELTDDISYPRRAAYFDRVIQKFHPGASILLDLACGTGSLSIELARLGYDVVGTDASQQMLSEAMLKKEIALYGENFEREEPSDPGIAKLLFLCQPMQELDMYGTLDAAVCALDSLNHVTDPQVVQRIFDRVSLFLNPGAVFVFDVNSVYKHREVLGNNTFTFADGQAGCVWRNRLEEDGRRVRITLEIQDGETGEAFREEFCEYTYELAEIRAALERHGFTLESVCDGETFGPLAADSERYFFCAVKNYTQLEGEDHG